MFKTFKESDIKMQGSLSPAELKAKIDGYSGTHASCDMKYKQYASVDVPKIDKYQLLEDLLTILKS